MKRPEETVNEKTEKALANTENIFAEGEGRGTRTHLLSRRLEACAKLRAELGAPFLRSKGGERTDPEMDEQNAVPQELA